MCRCRTNPANMADIKAQDPAAMLPYPKVKTKNTMQPINTPSPAVPSLIHIIHPDLDKDAAIAPATQPHNHTTTPPSR